MAERDPACLVIFIETAAMRWHLAAIGQDGRATPLAQSESGDLAEYKSLESDEQLSFLRHRLAGALQRGCDRLYVRNLKASHFLFLLDAPFPDAAEGITERLAEHFVQWMMNPAATFLISNFGFKRDDPCEFNLIAGDLPDSISPLIGDAFNELIAQLDKPGNWELIVSRQKR